MTDLKRIREILDEIERAYGKNVQVVFIASTPVGKLSLGEGNVVEVR